MIALLHDQHADAPAGVATLSRRQSLLAADQAPLRSRVAALGGTTTHSYQALNALALTVSPAGVAALRADPRVSAVVPDLDRARPAVAPREAGAGAPAAPGAVPGACPSNPAKPQLEPEALGLTHTASDDPNASTARSLGYTGHGVTVAFIADGIDPDNPDFLRKDGSKVFSDYQDFSGDGPDTPSSGAEAFGDASSIAAQGRVSYDLAKQVNVAHPLPGGCTIRIQGMAPGASLVGLKIFPNALLTAPTSVIIQAIDWAVTHDHVDVINESFGANPYPDTAQDPISIFNKNAVDAGVTVVASSGDAGIGNTAGTASTDPWVVSAGASTQLRSYAQETRYGFQLGNGTWSSNQVSSISSAGISQTNRVQDLLAPGDLGWALCSSRLQHDGTPLFGGCTDDNGQPADIQNFGGTSQSAPYTSGAAALVIQAYRQAHRGASPTPGQVRRVLDSSADDIGAPAQEQGAGLLDSYRAVQLAASLGTTGNEGAGLITEPQVSHVAEAGSSVTSTVVVHNQGKGAQTVTATTRDLTRQTGADSQRILLDATSPTTFVDGIGVTRAYRTATFSVAPGVGRLDAALSWPGDATKLVRMSLLDPQGTFTGYTLPQGLGNAGQFDVQRPAPGTWTAILYTAASSAGYTGPVTLRTTEFAAESAGTVSPATFTLPEGGSREVTVTITAPTSEASAVSLVLTGRFGQTTTVPIVTRAVQQVSTATPATFSGTFRNGNGRSFGPAQTDTYLFDVPAGAADLTVDLALSGTPANQVVAHLSDPSGEPVSTDTNYLPTTTDAGFTTYGGLQEIHARPVPGRYQLTVELLNPVSGAKLPQTYRGTVRLNGARVSATGVPSGGTVRRGAARQATVTVHNTSAVPQTYYLDARTDRQRTYDLVPVGPATVALPLPSEDVPSWLVPTRTTSLTVGGSATAPVQFDVMALDNPTALNAPSTPDVEAVPSGNSATAVHSAREVTSALWGAFPALTGPTNGRQSGSITMSAQVVTQGFDGDWTASTGDPLLATVQSAPAAHPVTVAPGGTATLTVTLSPSRKVGTSVQGTIYVNTLSPYGPTGLAGLGDEVAALPFAYTVG